MLTVRLLHLLALGSLVDMICDMWCCFYGPKVNVLWIEAFKDWLLRYLRDTLLVCFVCMNCVPGFDCLDKGWSKKVSKYELSSGDPSRLPAVVALAGRWIQMQGLKSGSFLLYFRYFGGSYVNNVNSVLLVFHTYEFTTNCCFSVLLGFVAW